MMSESLILVLASIVAATIFVLATTITVKHLIHEIKDMAFDMVSSPFIDLNPFSTTSCSLLSISCPAQINTSMAGAAYHTNEGKALMARAELRLKRK
jgi:hypothetical protein